MVEHLCFRGWRGQSQYDFYYKIERIGGFLRAITYMDHVVFEISVEQQFIVEAAHIIRGLFDEHIWCNKDLHSEKEVVLRQIEDEYFPLSKRMIAEYFFGNARTLSIMGARSHVKSFTKKELLAWKHFIFQPEKACIILTGNYTDDSLKLIQEDFSSIKSKDVSSEVSDLARDKLLQLKRYPSNIIYCGEKEFSSIGLLFQWDVKKISMTEMDFIRSLMATGFVAPLNLRLREELGLLDEIDSGVEYDISKGILYFTFELNHKNVALFFNELGNVFCSTIKKLDRGAFECTQACFVDRPSILLDNPQELAYLLGERTFIGNETFCTAEEYNELNRQITFTKMNDVVHMVFSSECLSTMVLTTDALYEDVDAAFIKFRKILNGEC